MIVYMPAMSRQLNPPRQFFVGTRASPLARAQTAQIVQALCGRGHCTAAQIKIIAIETRGDAAVDIASETPLAEIGGKGLFTAELDAALADGRIDFAVHSLKDLPTALPENFALAAIPPRADARDVLVRPPDISPDMPPDTSLQDLPQGAMVGTASLRRAAQLRALRPDLAVAPLRGNIGTRLDKLGKAGWGGIMLAAAGLARLDVWPPNAVALPCDYFVPAAAQGALAVQCRADDDLLIKLLADLNCPKTQTCVTAERAFLAALDGSCRTPIAAHARLQNENLLLHGRLLSADGAQMVEAKAACKIDPQAGGAAANLSRDMGLQMAAKLRAQAPHLVKNLAAQ